MGYSIRRNVYVNRYLYAVALDRVKKAFGKNIMKTQMEQKEIPKMH